MEWERERAAAYYRRKKGSPGPCCPLSPLARSLAHPLCMSARAEGERKRALLDIVYVWRLRSFLPQRPKLPDVLGVFSDAYIYIFCENWHGKKDSTRIFEITRGWSISIAGKGCGWRCFAKESISSFQAHLKVEKLHWNYLLIPGNRSVLGTPHTHTHTHTRVWAANRINFFHRGEAHPILEPWEFPEHVQPFPTPRGISLFVRAFFSPSRRLTPFILAPLWKTTRARRTGYALFPVLRCLSR